MPAHDPTGLYRLSMVREIEYDEALRIGQGYDYVLRVGERWPMLVVGECLYGYRVHARSITRTDPTRRQKLIDDVRRRASERRGAESGGLVSPNRPLNRLRNRDRDNDLAVHFIESVVDLRAAGRVLAAIGTGVRCARLHPMDPHYYKALMCSVLPRGVRRRIRPSERRLAALRAHDARRVA